MIRLPKALAASEGAEFEAVLKQELESLHPDQFPLQQALSQSCHVSDEPFSAILLARDGDEKTLRVVVGISYSGMIPGCSCADDPAPPDLRSEYCELVLEIDRMCAETQARLRSS